MELKNFFMIVVLGFLVFTLTGCAEIQTDEVIKLGWVGPLTGKTAQWGEPAYKTAKMAVDDVNSNGGVNGKLFELVVEDSQSEPKNAATAAQKFINQDKVDIILTHLSSESLVVAPLAEEAQIVMFASATSTPDLTEAGDYIFRVTPVNKEGQTIAEELEKNGIQKVALLTEQSKYTLPIKNAFEESYSGEIVLNEEFTSTDLDSRTLVTKVKESDIEAVVLFPETLVKISELLRSIQEQEVTADIYGNAAFNTPEIFDLVDPEMNNFAFATLYIDETYDLTAKFIEDYKTNYGEEMPNKAHTLDAATKIYILAEGMAICGDDTECLKDFLYGIKDKQTVSGILSIDENGDADKTYIIKRIVGEEIV